jgi:tRNA (guanine37-N1)-methyltransferase
VSAIESAEAALGGSKAERILLTPQGQPLGQSLVVELSRVPSMILIAGRYEGFDERIRGFVDRELSLGDFVMIGGEVAAMALVEACVRLVPGVLGNEHSPREESFSPEWDGWLEYPQFTRPQSFRGLEVPEILRSGDHAKIAAWRREQALERTAKRRPDLLKGRGR